MLLKNYTGHDLNIPGRVIPSEGCARVSGVFGPFDADGIATVTYGAVTGLPDPLEGTLYIVSALVASALPDRTDLVSPATGHPLARRDGGRVLEVPGFVRRTAFEGPSREQLRHAVVDLA